MFESAEKLGLKVVRMWAFNDGDGWNAVQPRIGHINEHVLRCRRLPCWTLHPMHVTFCKGGMHSLLVRSWRSNSVLCASTWRCLKCCGRVAEARHGRQFRW